MHPEIRCESRRLPDLRHGAGAGDGDRRDRSERRARRHGAAVLDCADLDRPDLRPGDGGHVAAHMWFGTGTSGWIQLVLATPVVLWAGAPFFAVAAGHSVTGNLNMFTLIALGTGVAWGYSVVATLAPGLRLATFRARRVRLRSISRPLPSSPCWCCSDRSWNSGPARRPEAPSALCSIWRPDRAAAGERRVGGRCGAGDRAGR